MEPVVFYSQEFELSPKITRYDLHSPNWPYHLCGHRASYFNGQNEQREAIETDFCYSCWQEVIQQQKAKTPCSPDDLDLGGDDWETPPGWFEDIEQTPISEEEERMRLEKIAGIEEDIESLKHAIRLLKAWWRKP
jgi:hypothetical protein